MINGLVASGIDRADIATTQYSLRRQERFNSNNAKTFEGWNTVHSFDVTLAYDDLKNTLNHIIIGDEVTIRTVRLQVTDRESAEKLARSLAISLLRTSIIIIHFSGRGEIE